MGSRSKAVEEFLQAFDSEAWARSVGALELTDTERDDLLAGIAALPDPIARACRVMLDDWPHLDPSGRVAALLALANALATAR
jgi:hypothetical protein